MRVLFVMPALPLAANHSGGASRYLQNFTALHRLGAEIHVVRLGTADAFAATAGFNNRAGVREEAASWRDLTYKSNACRLIKAEILWRSVVNPLDYQFPNARQVASLLRETIADCQPDLIWVESADLAAAIRFIGQAPRWLLSHTDIQYRIWQVRHGARSLSDLWFIDVCRRAEQRVFRSAPLILTGSSTDGARLRQMGGRAVHVIPMAYDTPPLITPAEVPQPPRIIHLGSLETTANRLGVQDYLLSAHAELQRSADLELWIVGDVSRLKEPLDGLLQKSGAILKGYVPDLAEVLRPYDISILPYGHDTGYRTKLPLLFSYGQVIVTTRAAVAGTQVEGLDKVCIVVDAVEDFPAAIQYLADHPTERARLGNAARAFFERHFTFEAVLDQYRDLLQYLHRSS